MFMSFVIMDWLCKLFFFYWEMNLKAALHTLWEPKDFFKKCEVRILDSFLDEQNNLWS